MAEDTLIRVVEEREALRAEVARLREELAKEQRLTRFSSTETRNALAEERNAHAKTQAIVARLKEELEADRFNAKAYRELQAAHEATKRQAEGAQAAEARVAELVERHGELSERAVLAEARVAELEGALRVVSDRAVSEALLRQDALSSARGLLERAKHGQFRDSHMPDDLDHWLRAHPEPATPAETPEQVCERLGIDVPAWAAEVRAKVTHAMATPEAAPSPVPGVSFYYGCQLSALITGENTVTGLQLTHERSGGKFAIPLKAIREVFEHHGVTVATPAAEYHSDGDAPAAVLSAVRAAYPAATGAEQRCKRCGMLQSECDLQRVEMPDPFDSAAKEQGA